MHSRTSSGNWSRKRSAVSESSESPLPYKVAYSGRARDSLRELVARARESGLAPQVLAAVKEIDRLLRVYPQFGQPLIDLAQERGQVWIGVVEPLMVRYAILEKQRLVIVAAPILPLPGSGL
jgi:hypothetical protein